MTGNLKAITSRTWDTKMLVQHDKGVRPLIKCYVFFVPFLVILSIRSSAAIVFAGKAARLYRVGSVFEIVVKIYRVK